MFLIFFIALLNLALGFSLAVYLGGQYRIVRTSKFGFALSRLEPLPDLEFNPPITPPVEDIHAQVENPDAAQPVDEAAPISAEEAGSLFQSAAADLGQTPAMAG
jgi:hypothetical protein